jgi:hypothetical protein
MDDFIFSAKSNSTNNKNSPNEFYTIVGNDDYLDSNGSPRLETESDKVCAKKLYRADGSLRFYIRLANNNSVYNPISLYGDEKPNTFLDRVVRSGFKFKEVNEKVFKMYLGFLKTKNVAWLHNAEREMI